jgi:AAA domain
MTGLPGGREELARFSDAVLHEATWNAYAETGREPEIVPFPGTVPAIPTNGTADLVPQRDQIPPPADEPPPKSEADYLAWLARNGVTGQEAEEFRKVATGTPFPEPEDRGTATLSTLGDVEYVADLIRPGRIVVCAAEEGAGKSYAIGGELAVRVAIAGGSFAGTWPVVRTGPVLYMSEMHADDDYDRESTVLASLELERSALAGRYFRLSLMTAAGGRPALTVPEWRAWVTSWCRDHAALLLIVDTATGATLVDPWGRAIQEVYAALRVMLGEYPELAIVLLLHLKKPQGRGERRLSDVLGEWGRWCDVVLLMEADGLTRAKLTVRKRVRHERRIVVTKAGGLLVDPQDATTTGPKVPADKVCAAVAANPGMTYAELGTALGVSKRTASNYVAALADRLDTVKGTAASGPGASVRVYPSRIAQDRETSTLRDPLAMEGEAIAHRESPYIEGRSLARSPASPSGGSPLTLAVKDWPEI